MGVTFTKFILAGIVLFVEGYLLGTYSASTTWVILTLIVTILGLLAGHGRS